MRYLFVIILLFSSIISPQIVIAGPFGTEMGEQKEKFQDIKPLDNTGFPGEVYYVNRMPKSHSDFEKYILIFGSEGLAAICAVSQSFINDSYGTQSRNLYDKLKEQLTEKYGAPKSFEQLKYNSIWKEPREFITSIEKHERQHGCEWTGNLPNNIKRIRIVISASSSSSSAVNLFYTYTNYDNLEQQKLNIDKESL